jgi:hypothetical protein
MYETNEYPTQGTIYGGSPDRRRKWLAAGGIVAAALILLLVIVAANHVRSNQASAAQALDTPTATPSAEPTGDPVDGEEPDQPGPGPGGGGGGTNPGGTNPGGTNPGGGDQGGEEPEEPEQPEPAAPLSIEATISAVAPGGHCSASGTISVDGGEYPLTVKFQWRALAFGEGWDGVPVSPVQSYTFDEPGGISVQTNELPEDGTNVFLVVSSPKETGSGLVAYDGCDGQAGGGVIGS